MVVPDACRAQLYLRRLTVGLEDLATALSRLGVAERDAHAALEGLARSLARELDSILLPTVALELAIAPTRACYLPGVLARDGYGWMEFVPHLGCGDERDVKRFFLRAGVLLAVAESLNLVDGHADNLVARGPHPVIVDLETLLHNHSRSPAGGESGI